LARESAGYLVANACDTAATTDVHLDFETRNTGGCDLGEAGAWRYAADPATEILTLVYQNDGKTRCWHPETGLYGPLGWFAADPAISFICYGDFEMAVWDHIMVARYGFPPIPLFRWDNAQATCSYLALPRALGKVLPIIGAKTVKDVAGRRLVLSLSRPHRKTGAYPEVTPEVRRQAFGYNRTDVEGLAAVHTTVGTLPGRERQVWELDQKINRRGVRIDTAFARSAKHIAEALEEALCVEFAELTKFSACKPTSVRTESPWASRADTPVEPPHDPVQTDALGLSPHQVDKTREWLKGRGFTLADLEAATVEDALENLVLPDDVRRVLQIRLITAPTSLKKFDAMLACVGADDRARGLFQYHGATPGRWSAALIQPQNLPRPTVEIDPSEIEELVAAVKTENPGALRRWGEPIDVLTSALRFALTATEGTRFGVGDFSMIETCVLLALAGADDKCRLIAEGVDIYRDMAATIFGLDREAFQTIPKDELTVEQQEQRQAGKVTILGCGYQMGADRFRQTYCRHMGHEEGTRFANDVVYNHYRKDWAPEVPSLWRGLEEAAREAMLEPGSTVAAIKSRRGWLDRSRDYKISYRLDTVAGLPCLVCTLPSGKSIYYQNARVSTDKVDRWGNSVWTYWAYRRGQWREIDPYGGQLTENVVQALARELLVDAMFRLEARGYPIVMHCHDEIVVEHPIITPWRMQEIMAESPQWAAEFGVPIAVEAWVGKRYRK
jgi:DNA polymerase